MCARREDRANRAKRRVKAAALAVSLAFSALLMVLVVGSPAWSGLAWISLLPLFAAVRFLRPIPAVLAGGWWGLCLYLFSIAGAAPSVSSTLSSLVLLAAVPAVYAGLGTLATRAFGFNPVILGLGWIAVEVALQPVGLDRGLLGGAQAEGTRLHWATEVLGYISVAFLVACANASLLAFLSRARWTGTRQWSLSGVPHSERRPFGHVSCWVQLLALRQAYPRAPPLA